MIQKFNLLLFFLIIGFLGTFSAYLFVSRQKIQVISPISITKFSLDKAPSQSLVGNIKSLSGDVLWQSRISDNSTIITKPIKIHQGEGIETGNNGKVMVEFSGISISALSNTKFNIIQTLKTNIVIQQNQGEVMYGKLDLNTPLSVRALDLLININDGKTNITVNKEKAVISIQVNRGSGQIAYKDLNNKSNVLGLAQGEMLTFNNNIKEVY